MSNDPPIDKTQLMSLADIQKEYESSQAISGNYLTLMVIEGRDFGYIFQLDRLDTVIGRKVFADEEGADIQLDDERASRRHMVIKRQVLTDNRFQVQVTDLHSTNGTFVNGRRLANSDVDIRNGDKIQIGNTILKFEVKNKLSDVYQERLYQQVTKDVLTGLWNHNHIRTEMEKLVSLGSRNTRPFSLILCELDLIQTINDTQGLTVGDNILRTVAKLLPNELGDHAILARYTGKQFLALLPETESDEAMVRAEKIRHAVESYDFSPLGCTQRVTFSIGVAQFPFCGNTTEELVKQTDEALYLSKQVGGNRVSLAAKLTKKSKLPWRKLGLAAAVVLLIGMLAGVSHWLYLQSQVAATLVNGKYAYSGVIESHEILVGSKVGGRVKEVIVEEGQEVNEGDILVRFDIDELLAQRRLLEARIVQAQANLKKLENGNRPEEIAQAQALVRKQMANLEELRNGPRPQEIAQAQADLAGAEADAATAELTYQRLNQIYQGGYTSRQDRDLAESRLNISREKANALRERLTILKLGNRKEEIAAAEEAYQQALAQAKLLQAGTRIEDIEEARGRLAETQADLAQLEVKINEGEVKSPTRSQIEVLNVRPGDLIPEGRIIAKLLEADQTWVRAYVPETELSRVHVGQLATITIDIPNGQRSVKGYVQSINSQAEFLPRNIQTRDDRKNQVFGIKVLIDNNISNKESIFKAGMAAEVSLD